MDAHLSDESRESGNRRNGRMSKTVQTRYGEVTVDTPRDRDGSFAPQTVRKRETILAEGMADQIIGMYAFGTSTRDISRYFEREFNTRLSAGTISAITDRVLPEIREWKTRSLDAVYAICWLDAIHYKVRDESGLAVPLPSTMCLVSARMGTRNSGACTLPGARVLTSGLRCSPTCGTGAWRIS